MGLDRVFISGQPSLHYACNTLHPCKASSPSPSWCSSFFCSSSINGAGRRGQHVSRALGPAQFLNQTHAVFRLGWGGIGFREGADLVLRWGPRGFRSGVGVSPTDLVRHAAQRPSARIRVSHGSSLAIRDNRRRLFLKNGFIRSY